MNTIPRSTLRCASALADAVWLQSRATRRSFAYTSICRSALSSTSQAHASGPGYTAYSLPKGGALPATAPRNLDETGDTSITLEAPRRATVKGADGQAKVKVEPVLEPQIQVQHQDQPQMTPELASASRPMPASIPAVQPRPRRPLRARKAAIKLTPSAVSQLRALVDDPEPRTIRIGVRNKGCSGLAYHLEYIRDGERGALDEEVMQDGVRVLVEGRALMSVIGSEMDWVEDRLSARFVFRNPNISESWAVGQGLASCCISSFTDVLLQRNPVGVANHSWYDEASRLREDALGN